MKTQSSASNEVAAMLYHIIGVDDRRPTFKEYFTEYPVPHDQACTMLHKIEPRRMFKHRRVLLEDVVFPYRSNRTTNLPGTHFKQFHVVATSAFNGQKTIISHAPLFHNEACFFLSKCSERLKSILSLQEIIND